MLQQIFINLNFFVLQNIVYVLNTNYIDTEIGKGYTLNPIFKTITGFSTERFHSLSFLMATWQWWRPNIGPQMIKSISHKMFRQYEFVTRSRALTCTLLLNCCLLFAKFISNLPKKISLSVCMICASVNWSRVASSGSDSTSCLANISVSVKSLISSVKGINCMNIHLNDVHIGFDTIIIKIVPSCDSKHNCF